jgi:ligand-binding SRPBCC domain-containing protein
MAAGHQASVVQTSRVAAPADAVWRRAVSPEGINHELGPWLRMTMPASIRGMGIDDVPLGEPLGRSWILLFGLIPVDYDDLLLAEREPGRRFLERSRLLTMATWQHEREVRAVGEGCEVADRLAFELRRGLAAVPGAQRMARAVIAWLFRHRHRRLVAWFGAAP